MWTVVWWFMASASKAIHYGHLRLLRRRVTYIQALGLSPILLYTGPLRQILSGSEQLSSSRAAAIALK